MIYHITYKKDWEKAFETGLYEAPSLVDEGFIHCSELQQVDATLTRYYVGKTGLVKLVIDPLKLSSQLIHEWSPSNTETFPHIYGPINVDAVMEVIDVS
ncbi:DUF952 domain-containing protein [Flavihumibacter fluvii]|uniref:DUF952 domain-containing protein n=1 Tax=Flavihumibacter fluvii TaxID=2838157 RepID=UPI001BDE6985|nr:DUF952 domain-containing protein [Flavihumibacter fluvii]ULQ53480.1 DUF952 domain-containing protein [Flavihumibacter fluvii]